MSLADININGDLIKGAFEGVGGFIQSVRSAITGKISPEKEAEIIAKAAEIDAALAKAQNEINSIEAGSKFFFVSGWRPFIGWVCGVALAYNYVLMPFIVYFMNVFVPNAPAMPALEMGELTTLLFGMLGLGAMKSYDKKVAAGR